MLIVDILEDYYNTYDRAKQEASNDDVEKNNKFCFQWFIQNYQKSAAECLTKLFERREWNLVRDIMKEIHATENSSTNPDEVKAAVQTLIAAALSRRHIWPYPSAAACAYVNGKMEFAVNDIGIDHHAETLLIFKVLKGVAAEKK